MICGERSIVNDDGINSIAISLRCRAWTCTHCRPRRRQQLITLAASGAPNRLITLTVSPAVGISPAHRAKMLANAWRLVVKRAKRAFGWQKLEYCAVFEATKRGEPHLHILARCGFIPQRWLSAQMADLIKSPICDVREVKSVKHAAIYVAKYIGKAPHRFATCKRYWYTQGWVNGSSDDVEAEHWGTVRWELDDRPIYDIFKAWGGFHGACFLLNCDIVIRGKPPPGVEPGGLYAPQRGPPPPPPPL